MWVVCVSPGIVWLCSKAAGSQQGHYGWCCSALGCHFEFKVKFREMRDVTPCPQGHSTGWVSSASDVSMPERQLRRDNTGMSELSRDLSAPVQAEAWTCQPHCVFPAHPVSCKDCKELGGLVTGSWRQVSSNRENITEQSTVGLLQYCILLSSAPISMCVSFAGPECPVTPT